LSRHRIPDDRNDAGAGKIAATPVWKECRGIDNVAIREGDEFQCIDVGRRRFVEENQTACRGCGLRIRAGVNGGPKVRRVPVEK
jgi:hypothetical protein